MQSEARTIMKELREDHRNMATVLDLLDDAVRDSGRGPGSGFRAG